MKGLKWVWLVWIVWACGGDDHSSDSNIDYRGEMRSFVEGISQYAKTEHAAFLIIPQNGIELVTEDGEADGTVSSSYLSAIDGNGQEDLFYGYDADDQATDAADTEYLLALLDVSRSSGNTIMVTDYCSTHDKMDDSYAENAAAGFISFAADERDLYDIPDYPGIVYSENDSFVTSLSEAHNFLYLINPEQFTSRQEFIAAVTATNYDLLVMDLFFNDQEAFTAAEVEQLRAKANGGSRLVISYMSIGEAEDYRYYWQSSWSSDKPSWLAAENPEWAGNYKVRYWYAEWQAIIYGSENAYLDRILAAEFDGVYLDIIDAFEYFE